MRAIIEVDVPDYQIGQEASIYFKDTMMIKGIVQEPSETIHGSTYGGVSWGGTYKPQEPCNDANANQYNSNALNALEGDAISRQAVKDKYKERLVNSLKDDDRGIDLSKYAEEPYKAFCEFVDSIPPINSQEPSRNMEEIAEIMRCDVDAETKCRMISNILTAKPHYFEKQEPKMGHWITEHPLDYLQPDEYKCSECGHYYYKKVNECPNCFAKMIESQGSESDA